MGIFLFSVLTVLHSWLKSLVPHRDFMSANSREDPVRYPKMAVPPPLPGLFELRRPAECGIVTVAFHPLAES